MRSESQPHTGRFHFPFWGLNADPERDHVKLPACHRKEDTSDRLLREERQFKEYFRTVTPREIEAPWHLKARVGKKLSRDCPDFHNHPDHDATWPIMSCVGRRSTCLPWTSWWQRSAGGQLCARPSGGTCYRSNACTNLRGRCYCHPQSAHAGTRPETQAGNVSWTRPPNPTWGPLSHRSVGWVHWGSFCKTFHILHTHTPIRC